MNYFNALLVAVACTWITGCGNSANAAQTSADPKAQPNNNYGDIILFDADGVKNCTLSVPETKETFNFSNSSQTCTNNTAASFILQNIPSATLIQFYSNELCSDAKNQSNFFVKLKTVKQPTDWTTPAPGESMNFIDLQKKKAGDLIPKKYIRVEDHWNGSDFDGENWDEHISCVYIERSQPVN
ncbi:hypothetical protein [Pseudomonas silesiensis]